MTTSFSFTDSQRGQRKFQYIHFNTWERGQGRQRRRPVSNRGIQGRPSRKQRLQPHLENENKNGTLPFERVSATAADATHIINFYCSTRKQTVLAEQQLRRPNKNSLHISPQQKRETTIRSIGRSRPPPPAPLSLSVHIFSHWKANSIDFPHLISLILIDIT